MGAVSRSHEGDRFGPQECSTSKSVQEDDGQKKTRRPEGLAGFLFAALLAFALLLS